MGEPVAMNVDAKALCLNLMRADSEREVVALLSEAGYWNDSACWRYIGDYDGNWSTIGNQQSEAIAALTEKFINSIDSTLCAVKVHWPSPRTR